MSEFISTSNYIKHRFEQQNLDKMKTVLDLDGDGFIGQLELDQANSYCLMNTLQSINPVSFQHLDKFRLNSGMFLTESQKRDREKIVLLIDKLTEEQAEEDAAQERSSGAIVKRRHNVPDSNNGIPTDDGSLMDDLKHRRVLEDSEITNNN